MGDDAAAPAPQQRAAHAALALAAADAVRHFERAHGRQLIDTRLGGWADMPSEAALKAVAHWGLKAHSPGVPVRLPRYLSVRDGRPQRFIDIHVLSQHRPDLRLRQSQLLGVAELGKCAWLYAVHLEPLTLDGAQAHPLALQDPARAPWVPPGVVVGSDPSAGDGVWRLPWLEARRYQESTTAGTTRPAPPADEGRGCLLGACAPA